MIISLTLLFLCQTSLAEELYGKVISIADGDTFTLRADNQKIRVRLGEIDAPEDDQAFGNESKRMLSKLVSRKKVRVVIQDVDQYGRFVGRVYVSGKDVNAEMVRGGGAWVYRKYLKDNGLLKLERSAKKNNVGLWGLSEKPTAPWKWRIRQAKVDKTSAQKKCNIKGNINSKGTRIYHLPGMEHYNQTRISKAKGERWFCSEREAKEAGWRKARSG